MAKLEPIAAPKGESEIAALAEIMADEKLAILPRDG